MGTPYECSTALTRIHACFGRAAPRLAEVFGVSPLELRAWLASGTAPVGHREKLRQVNLASEYLLSQGVKPTVVMVDRTVAQGKSFLQLLAGGANGLTTAEALVRLERRSEGPKEKLRTLLVGCSSW